jgi:hypothetical protein
MRTLRKCIGAHERKRNFAVARTVCVSTSLSPHRLLRRTPRSLPAGHVLGRPLWILGPDDLAVLKLVFNRRKDLADVEELLRADVLDVDFVRARLTNLVGEDDERLRAFQEIMDDVRG